MKIRLAEADDNRSLKRIDSLCTQGKSMVYHYERDDFFLRSRQYDRSYVYVAEIDGVIVGSVSAAIKTVRYNGKFTDIVYYYDIRVDPYQRRKGIASALYEATADRFFREGAEYAYIYILGSNLPSMKLTKTLGAFKMATFRVYFLSVPRDERDVLCVKEGDIFDYYCSVIEEDASGYDLSGEKSFIRNYVSPAGDSPFRGIFSLPDHAGAHCSLWDSSLLSTKVVDKVSLGLRLAAALPPKVKNMLRIPDIPAKGEMIRARHLFDLQWSGKDRAGFDKLITAVCARAGNEGARIVMCHLDTRDPLCDIIRRHARYSIEGNILMRTPNEGEVPPPLRTTYLDVRDF
jgi:ribosomal protein S18 acetylase RimI-like enzyme